jgi:predicted secreted protein
VVKGTALRETTFKVLKLLIKYLYEIKLLFNNITSYVIVTLIKRTCKVYKNNSNNNNNNKRNNFLI